MLPKRYVFVVNGHPRAGKDTSVEVMSDILMANGYLCGAFSSIDPVRELLAPVTDFKGKTEDDRALLAEVGFAVEKHSGWRTEKVLQFVKRHMHPHFDAVVFVHMREPELIDKLRDLFYLAMPDVVFRTIFVSRPGVAQVTSNSADANVEAMTYDATIHNNGSLEQLRAAAFAAIVQLIADLKEPA